MNSIYWTQIPSKSPNGEYLRKFRVLEADQRTTLAFSPVSVHAFPEFWKLMNLATTDYISNKVGIGICPMKKAHFLENDIPCGNISKIEHKTSLITVALDKMHLN